ncbi:MAG: type I DNA topoisomerase [candidate division WOR-3 bacterium]|nr:MAG: type I DNA topoisomerase [candidate division WOR-3 bacterium]
MAKKKVIIVESPTKSKTIKGFLGSQYVLVSSKGHIKDLPKSKLGVDVENNFSPQYIKIRGKAKIINEIKRVCKNSSEIFLAPDPDREGEAIAQHLAEELNSNGANVRRALFYEITPDHVRHALANPTTINQNLVDAHKARRVLDRIVGYYTSPILWTIIKRGLSAGRVQSVALRLICEREEEIDRFVSTPYWVADAQFSTADNERFHAVLLRIGGESRKISSKEELKRLQDSLKDGTIFTVTSFRTTNPTRLPPPPFITSTLEQEASKRFSMSARKTMHIAQSLYEGINLPEGRIGLITYMRTDSIRVNAEALDRLREYIAGKYGSEYLHKEIRRFKDRKGAQAGHEAIRPTKIKVEPDTIKEHLTPEQYKIYKLIFNRYVASQMAPARYRQKEAIVSFGDVDFRAEELKPVFAGYQILTGEITERGNLPKMAVGDKVTLTEIEFEEKQTEPSPRYTEATLIKKLEVNGIGRPSTYAQIIQTLFERHYVVKSEGRISPTELGIQVYKIIIPRFPNIFAVSFTAKMEKEFDQVENGTKSWQNVVREFYDPFVVSLNDVKKEADKLKEKFTEKVNKTCPKCDSPLIIRWGKYGKFLACSGFPDCKYSENIIVEKSNKKCPECNRELIIRHGRFGKFLACSGYPECRHTENMVHDVPCRECGAEMIIIATKRGKVFKCKQCDFSSFYPPIDEKCPTCGKTMLAKRGKSFCPDCHKPKKKKK